MGSNSTSMQKDLNKYLHQYRNAPHGTTGQSPAILFMGRNLRSRLDLIRPDNINSKITEKQYINFNPNFRTFQQNENVYFLSENPRMDKWIPGVIVSRWGDLHYEIEYHGKRVKRHVNQITSIKTDKPKRKQHLHECVDDVVLPLLVPHADNNLADRGTSQTRNHIETTPADPEISTQQNDDATETNLSTRDEIPSSTPIVNDRQVMPRRSTRQRKPRILFSP